MKMNIAILVLFMIALLIIGFLLYPIVYRPQKIQIYNELPPPARIRSDWWGYGWRPWWRQYGGVPGFQKGDPLPEPKMPVAPKPIIIQRAS